MFFLCVRIPWVKAQGILLFFTSFCLDFSTFFINLKGKQEKMANAKFGTPVTSTTTGCFPAATTLTGTIETSGTRVIGTGTAFKSEIQEGQYLYNNEGVVRKIKTILDDTHMILESAFSVDLVAGTALNVSKAQYRSVAIENTGVATGKLQGGDLPEGSKSLTAKSGFLVDPFGYDGTGTSITITAEN